MLLPEYNHEISFVLADVTCFVSTNAYAKALRRAGPDVLARVRAALGDPSWEVRQAAAKALGRLRAEGAVDQLEARTDDPHQEVAAAARAALKQIRCSASSGARDVDHMTPRGRCAQVFRLTD